MKMTPVQITKVVSRFVVGLSTGACVGAVVKNNVAPPENTIQKVETEVGSYVVGAMVADVSRVWVDRKIDNAVLWINQNIALKKPLQ